MIGWILVVLALAALGAILINPKIGLVLVWPMLFVYPHLYMERLQLMPWNIGVDDLFICVFFLVVLIRRNLLGGVPIRFGFALKGALAFMVIWTVASLSGWSIEPHMYAVEIVKPILKWGVFLLLVYSMVHTIDDERDLRLVAFVYVGSLTLAGVTVILHKLFPSQMVIFTAEWVTDLRGLGTNRPMGSFGSANTGCAVLGMTVIFTMMLLRLRMTTMARVLLVSAIPVLLIAMVLTESRSGLLALGSTLGAMCVLNRSRVYVAALVALMCMAVVFKPVLFLDVWDRIADVYSTDAGGQWGKNAEGRFELWKGFVQQSTAQTVVLGQGRTVAMYRVGGHSHNTYISATLVLGVAGAIWTVAFFGTLITRARRLALRRLPPCDAIGSGVAWAMVAWLVAGLTLDMLLTHNSTYVYLIYAAMIDRASVFAQRAAPVQLPYAVHPGLERLGLMRGAPAGVGN